MNNEHKWNKACSINCIIRITQKTRSRFSRSCDRISHLNIEIYSSNWVGLQSDLGDIKARWKRCTESMWMDQSILSAVVSL